MPFFLIMEYFRAGSNFLTFTYYLRIFNTCVGFVGEGFHESGGFWGLVVLFFFLMDRLQSGPCKHLVRDTHSSVSYGR